MRLAFPAAARHNASMSLLRFLMFLSLIVWLGGLIFFPVVAQASFAVLPTRHLAGLVVGHSLVILHWMGIVSGAVFLTTSLLFNRLVHGTPRAFSARHIFVVLMLALTLVSQFAVIPRMEALRASVGGDIDTVSLANPAHIQFDSLHIWSTRIEEAVILFGLVLAYMTASAFATRR